MPNEASSLSQCGTLVGAVFRFDIVGCFRPRLALHTDAYWKVILIQLNSNSNVIVNRCIAFTSHFQISYLGVG